jgi:peptidyl-prolyl cis-trans isomerase C
MIPMKHVLRRLPLGCLLLTSLLLAACTGEPEGASDGSSQLLMSRTSIESADPGGDVIARVGDQTIAYSSLNTMLNSSAVVGLSVPAVGTPQRVNVQLMLLDKLISANLLYLDALKQGADKDPRYQQELQRFSDGLLAGLYRMKALGADTEVTEEEIQAFYESSIDPQTELNDETRTAIEASLRKKKMQDASGAMREDLRKGVDIKITQENLHPDEDAVRSDSDVMATVGSQTITWAEARPMLFVASQRSSASAGRLDPLEERIEALDKLIDRRIMAQKAREAGLEQDPVYQRRFSEYRKTRLINFHRRNLLVEMEPSEEEISAYFAKNKGRISVAEERKVQMVVLKTKDEAETIKRKIESGELTIYQAAMEHSIDPNAKQTLGEIGWVAKDSGFPELDKLTFSLGPDEIGGPVESPAGWHLVKVLDMREAQLQDIADDNTRKITRRTIMHERLDDYVVGLRKNSFEVVVYNDRLNHLAKEEAEWVASLEKKAQQADSRTEQRKEELKKFMQP